MSPFNGLREKQKESFWCRDIIMYSHRCNIENCLSDVILFCKTFFLSFRQVFIRCLCTSVVGEFYSDADAKASVTKKEKGTWAPFIWNYTLLVIDR